MLYLNQRLPGTALCQGGSFPLLPVWFVSGVGALRVVGVYSWLVLERGLVGEPLVRPASAGQPVLGSVFSLLFLMRIRKGYAQVRERSLS